uniref:Uncharacterized protein n=1 Tax=Arundo donax TaxID=35708 RepID=A0A0A9BVJ8_ARUDO
MFMWYTSRLKY